VAGNGSGSCSQAGFGISDDESSCSSSTVLVNNNSNKKHARLCNCCPTYGRFSLRFMVKHLSFFIVQLFLVKGWDTPRLKGNAFSNYL